MPWQKTSWDGEGRGREENVTINRSYETDYEEINLIQEARSRNIMTTMQICIVVV